MIVLRA